MDTEPENLVSIPVTIDVRKLPLTEVLQLHQALEAEIQRRRKVATAIEKDATGSMRDSLAKMGAFHLEAGTRDFTEWSQSLIEDTNTPLTDTLLRETWQRALDLLRESGLDIEVEDIDAG